MCIYNGLTGWETTVFIFTLILADTAEVIQSRLNEQEGREEFYVHYVGCKSTLTTRHLFTLAPAPLSPHAMTCCPSVFSQQTPGRMGGEGSPGPHQDREGRGEEEHGDRGHR